MVGTPLGRRIATFAFLTFLLPPVGTIPLRKLRAVAFEVAGSLTEVALVAASRSGHRRSAPRDVRHGRRPGQVVDVEVDCGLFNLFEVEGTIPMMHMLYKLEFRREGIEQHISVRVVEDLLLHVLQPPPQIVHCTDEVNWVATWFHGLGEKFLPARRTGFFHVAAEMLLRGVPGGSPVAQVVQLLALVRPHADVRRSFGHKEQDGK